MAFRGAANIDPNQHKGLIISNSITNAPLVATGLSLTNAQPLHVAMVDDSGSQSGVSSNPIYIQGSITPSGTQDVNLTKVSGTAISLGQTTMSASLPITIASDQSSIPVSQSGTWNIATVSAVTAITNPLPAGTNVIGHVITDTGSTTAVTGTVTVSGTVTANAKSSTVPVSTMNNASANSGVNSAIAAVFDDTSPTAITENNFGFLRMSANRNQYTTIRDAAGNERGVNVTSGNALTVDASATTQPISYATTGSGTSTGALRVELPTNGTGVVGLNAGTAEIGNVKNSGTFAVQNTPTVPSSIFNGKTTVTTAGTRVVLASSQAVRSVVIKALISNTGLIYVGNSSVSSSNGLQLSAGDSVSLDIANLNTVNIDSAVNGEGVTYVGT